MMNKPGQEHSDKDDKEKQNYNTEKSKMDSEGGNHGLSGEEMDRKKEALEKELPDKKNQAAPPTNTPASDQQ